MRKLTLELDSLAVETFETVTPPAARGTVQGMSDGYLGCSQRTDCNAQTWDGPGCDSTQLQDLCTCSGGGGANNTSCNNTCVTCNLWDETCNAACAGFTADIYCPTNPGYQGCTVGNESREYC